MTKQLGILVGVVLVTCSSLGFCDESAKSQKSDESKVFTSEYLKQRDGGQTVVESEVAKSNSEDEYHLQQMEKVIDHTEHIK